jgi:acyl-coenzyme A thioesterase PaaI-like protein
VRAGPLIGTGFVERVGRRLIFARAQLRGGDGSELLASAHTVMSVLEANK